MSAKFSNYFLLLAVGILTLLSSFDSFAQNSSNLISLEGTEWQAKPYQTVNIDDNSLVDISFTYIFDKQGNVIFYTLSNKGAGSKIEPIQTSPIYDPQINSPFQQRIVPTPLTTSSSKEIGTYKIKGNSIYLEFSAYTVSATIYGNSMKGLLTYKNISKKEEWIINRASSPNNSKSISQTGKSKSDSATENAPSSKAMNIRVITTVAMCSVSDADILPNNKQSLEAIKEYTQEINLYSEKNYLAYLYRGDCKLETGDNRGAIADYNEFFTIINQSFQQAIKLKAENSQIGESFLLMVANAYRNRGIARNNLGDKVNACGDFREACKLGNTDACDKVKKVCN